MIGVGRSIDLKKQQSRDDFPWLIEIVDLNLDNNNNEECKVYATQRSSIEVANGFPVVFSIRMGREEMKERFDITLQHKTLFVIWYHLCNIKNL